jgi:hypothetical protein
MRVTVDRGQMRLQGTLNTLLVALQESLRQSAYVLIV